MNTRDQLGGIIHTYQRYDPVNFPSPTAPPPDLASSAMEHLLFYGSTRELTEEELANAVMLDPSQIRGLGPSLDALTEMLKEEHEIAFQFEAVDRNRDGAINSQEYVAYDGVLKAAHELAQAQKGGA